MLKQFDEMIEEKREIICFSPKKKHKKTYYWNSNTLKRKKNHLKISFKLKTFFTFLSVSNFE
jgi:hypothetical protein